MKKTSRPQTSIIANIEETLLDSEASFEPDGDAPAFIPSLEATWNLHESAGLVRLRRASSSGVGQSEMRESDSQQDTSQSGSASFLGEVSSFGLVGEFFREDYWLVGHSIFGLSLDDLHLHESEVKARTIEAMRRFR